MRHLVLLPLVLILAGCAAQPTPTPIPPSPIKDWTITVTWNYDFTNYPACSATITTGCPNGFTWGYIKGTMAIPLKTTPLPFTACAAPPATLTPPCVDTTTSPLTFHDQANGVLGIGAITPYVVINGIDNNGNSVSSAQDLAAVDNISLGSATNLSWGRK